MMFNNLFKNKWMHFLMICSVVTLMTSCGDDDDGTSPEEEFMPEEKMYTMHEADVEGISGTLTMTENEDGSTTVTIALDGVPSGAAESHPAHIHFGPAAEGGGIAVTLEPVDNETGMSETVVTETDDGEELSYSDLEMYDGYVNVHLSMEDLATIVAQADIGANALTGEYKTYPLEAADVDNVSGTAKFSERENGSTLVEIMVEGDVVTGDHPTHIHEGSVGDNGDIAFPLSDVNAEGMSVTHIPTDEIEYSDLIMYDGYINVHASADDLATIVVEGNIGVNAENGNGDYSNNDNGNGY